MMILFYFAAFVITIALLVRGIGAIFSPEVRKALAQNRFLYAGLLLFVLAVWFLPWGIPLGALAASADARRAKFRLYTTPISPSTDTKQRIAFARILNDRYGIRSSPLRGCLVLSQNAVDFERGYDAIMTPAIKRHFRRDIFAECEAAAGFENRPPPSSQLERKTNPSPDQSLPSVGIPESPANLQPPSPADWIVPLRATKMMMENHSAVTYLSISGNNQKNTYFAAPLDEVLKTPAWDGFPDNPPLSLPQAVKIARQWHKQNGRYAPNIFAVNLQEKPQTSKRWAYIIYFDPNTDRKMTGGGEPAFVVILFDGRVVGPVRE